MNNAVGVGLGIVGIVLMAGTIVNRIIAGNKEKAAASANGTTVEYCADDEVPKAEGWETSRPMEAL